MTYDSCDCDYCRSKYPGKSGKSHCDCDSCKKYQPKKSCQERIGDLIASVVNIENALAKAIETECEKIKKGNFTSEELNCFINKLENLLKLAINKEIILDFLIEDTMKACKKNEDDQEVAF